MSPRLPISPRVGEMAGRPEGGNVERRSGDQDVPQRAYAAAASVPDPEIPCVTVEDLGILRSVEISVKSVAFSMAIS